MHIAEGVLSVPMLAAGAAGAAACLAYGLRRLPEDRLMTAGLAAAAFFCASLIHIPIGISSVHLILNGLVGVLLGAAAVPVIFVALLLQGILFQFGGLTVLGVNTLTMGLGAVAAGALFRMIAGRSPTRRRLAAGGFAAGVSGVFISAVLTALAMVFTYEGFRASAAALLAAHLPVMAIEGVITALVCGFIARTKPGFFDAAAEEEK